MESAHLFHLMTRLTFLFPHALTHCSFSLFLVSLLTLSRHSAFHLYFPISLSLAINVRTSVLNALRFERYQGATLNLCPSRTYSTHTSFYHFCSPRCPRTEAPKHRYCTCAVRNSLWKSLCAWFGAIRDCAHIIFYCCCQLAMHLSECSFQTSASEPYVWFSAL